MKRHDDSQRSDRLPVTFAHPGDPHESLTARRAYASVPHLGRKTGNQADCVFNCTQQLSAETRSPFLVPECSLLELGHHPAHCRFSSLAAIVPILDRGVLLAISADRIEISAEVTAQGRAGCVTSSVSPAATCASRVRRPSGHSTSTSHSVWPPRPNTCTSGFCDR